MGHGFEACVHKTGSGRCAALIEQSRQELRSILMADFTSPSQNGSNQSGVEQSSSTVSEDIESVKSHLVRTLCESPVGSELSSSRTESFEERLRSEERTHRNVTAGSRELFIDT